jgi:hypothetical protein
VSWPGSDPSVLGRILHAIDYEDLNGALGRLEFEPELLLHRCKQRRPRGWHGIGLTQARSSFQREGELPSQRGLIPHRPFQVECKDVGEPRHAHLLHNEFPQPGCGPPDATVSRLEPRPGLADDQRINWKLPSLAMQSEMKSIREQCLHHLQHLFARQFACARGGSRLNVEAREAYPARSSRDWVVLQLISDSQQVVNGQVASGEPAARREVIGKRAVLGGGCLIDATSNSALFSGLGVCASVRLAIAIHSATFFIEPPLRH